LTLDQKISGLDEKKCMPYAVLKENRRTQ
jgi:hypothetical protein